jgi:hypothetical protein
MDKSGRVLTNKQIKAEIMSARGWTSEQYTKEYDKFRNRYKNYERVTGDKINRPVNELLFLKTKSETGRGASYRPSQLIQAIEATPSTSTGRVSRVGIGKAAAFALKGQIVYNYRAFIKKSASAREAVAEYDKKIAAGGDATEAYRALKRKLSDISETIKTAKKAAKEEEARTGIPAEHKYRFLYE